MLFSPSFRLLLSGCCVVVLVLATGSAMADDETFTLQPIPPEPAGNPGKPPRDLSGLQPVPQYSPKTYTDPAVPPFADSGLGAQPHLGAPDDGGIGYRHFDFPSYRYDIWYRPHAFGVGQAERCAPAPFRPRGYGNLFAEPSNCYRMDYSRYQLKEYRSDYGPSYYKNLPDPRCPDWDYTQQYRPECQPGRLRNTQVWTLNQHGVSQN